MIFVIVTVLAVAARLLYRRKETYRNPEVKGVKREDSQDFTFNNQADPQNVTDENQKEYFIWADKLAGFGAEGRLETLHSEVLGGSTSRGGQREQFTQVSCFCCFTLHCEYVDSKQATVLDYILVYIKKKKKNVNVSLLSL